METYFETFSDDAQGTRRCHTDLTGRVAVGGTENGDRGVEKGVEVFGALSGSNSVSRSAVMTPLT